MGLFQRLFGGSSERSGPRDAPEREEALSEEWTSQDIENWTFLLHRAWPEVLWEEELENWQCAAGAWEYSHQDRERARAAGVDLLVGQVIREQRVYAARYEIAAVRVSGALKPTKGPDVRDRGVVVITAHDDWLLAWRRSDADAMPPIDELVAEMQRRGVQPL